MEGQKSSQQNSSEKEKNTEDEGKPASKSFHPKKKFLKDYQSESKGNCTEYEEVQSTPTCSRKNEEINSVNEKSFSISSCLGKIVETEINKYQDKELVDDKKQFLPLLSKFDNMESNCFTQNKSDAHSLKFTKKPTDDKFEKNVFNASSVNIPLSNAFEIRNLQLQSQLQHELQQQQLLQYQLQLGIQNNSSLLSRELPTADLINDNEIQRPGQLLTTSPNQALDESSLNPFNANKIITHQNNLNNLKYNTDSNYNIAMQHYTNKLGERFILNDTMEQTNSPKIRFNEMSNNSKPKQSHTLYSTFDKPPSLLSSSSSSSSSHIKFNIPNLNLGESSIAKLTSEDYYRMLKHQPEQQQLVQQQQQQQPQLQQHHDRIIRFHPSPDPYNSPHPPPFLSSSSSASSSSSSSRVRPTSDEVPMDLSVKRPNNMVYQNFGNNMAGSKKMRTDLNNYDSLNNSNNNNINIANNGIKIINHGNIVNSNDKQNIRSSFIYTSPDSDKIHFKESSASYPKKAPSQEYVKKSRDHVNDNQPYHLPFKQHVDSGLKNKHRNNIDNFNTFKGNDFDHYQDGNFQKTTAIRSNKYDQTPLMTTMIAMKPHEAPQIFQNRLVTLNNSQEHLNSVSNRNHLNADNSRHRSFNPQNDSSSPSSIPFLLPISPLGNQIQQPQQYFDTQGFPDDSNQIQQKFQCKICDSIHCSYRNFRIHFVKDHGMEPHPEHCFHLSKPAYSIGHSRNFYKGHSENMGTNTYHLAQKQVAEVTPMVAKVPAMPIPIPTTVSALIQTDESSRTVVPSTDIQTSETNRSLNRRESREPMDGSRQESNAARIMAKKTNLMSIFEGFEDVTDWRVHISSMHMIRSCSCKTCNRNFANAEELNKHLHNCHLDSMDFDVEYKCIYCSKAFTDDEVLFIHTREHEKLLCIAHIDQLSRDNQVTNEIPMVPDTTCPEFDGKGPCKSVVNNDSSSPNSESNLREKIPAKRRSSSSSTDDINVNQVVVDQREVDNISRSSIDSDFMPHKKKHFMKKFQEEKKINYDNMSEEHIQVEKSKLKIKKSINLPLESSPAKSHQPARDQPQPSTSGHSGTKVITARNIIDDIVNENLTKTSPPPTFKKMFPHFGIEEDSNPMTSNMPVAFTQSHINVLDQQLLGNSMNKCGVGLPSFKEESSISEKNKNFNFKNVSLKQSVQQYQQQQKNQPLSQQQPLLKDMLSQIKSPSSLSAASDPGPSSLGAPSTNQSKSKCVRDICDEIITHSFREDVPNGSTNDRLKILDSICFSNMKLEKRTSDSRSSTDTIITQAPSKSIECENVFEDDANSCNNNDDNGDTNIHTNATTSNSSEKYNNKPKELENFRNTSGSVEDEIRDNKNEDVNYSA